MVTKLPGSAGAWVGQRWQGGQDRGGAVFFEAFDGSAPGREWLGLGFAGNDFESAQADGRIQAGGEQVAEDHALLAHEDRPGEAAQQVAIERQLAPAGADCGNPSIFGGLLGADGFSAACPASPWLSNRSPSGPGSDCRKRPMAV